MEYAVNSITSVNTMYLGVVNRFAYISTVVTKDMKRVVTGPLVKTDSPTCGDAYQKGFMAGCLSVVGNDKEVCNLAEDA